LWLLEEPTVTLDAAATGQLAALMARHCGQGGMIIAASHQDLALKNAQTLTLSLALAPAFEDALLPGRLWPSSGAISGSRGGKAAGRSWGRGFSWWRRRCFPWACV